MTKEKAREILKEYKANEEINAHSENYLLLARAYGDERATKLAQYRLEFIKEDSKYSIRRAEEMRKEVHQLCNPYYYQLVKLADLN